jgi:hypothetical protein
MGGANGEPRFLKRYSRLASDNSECLHSFNISADTFIYRFVDYYFSLAFVHTYSSMIPNNGHKAVALTFFNNTPADKAKLYLASIEGDSRVDKVFLNVSPDSVKTDPDLP